MPDAPRPVVLMILDGFGCRESPEDNAIAAADKPNWDRLWDHGAHATVDCSGINVGLPRGQMGNSEVGHLNLGSGRIVPQDYTRISDDIESGAFQVNPVLVKYVDTVVNSGHALHLLGLLSPGGVHSHQDHIFAMVRMAADRGARNICMHAILDGRDVPPRSAADSLAAMQALFDELGCGRIATISGRYYAMDRDNRWDRVERAYRLYTSGESQFRSDDAGSALLAAYDRGENDEFVAPTRIGAAAPIQDNDVVIFMNYRADRARELTHALTAKAFDSFERGHPPSLAGYVCLTEYDARFNLPAAYPPQKLHNGLGEYVASLGLKQLRIAETEKYAHVTFFFNGGREEPFPGEERILVPSPRVATYDLQPEMSAPEVAAKLVAAVESDRFDLIICNFANADMVGHTGKMDAARQAIEALDSAIGLVADALQKVGGELLITADHGNAEQMSDPATGQAHTAHTTNLVPLVYVGRPARLADGGLLSDVAPTVLTIMGLPQPKEMTGRSLITLEV